MRQLKTVLENRRTDIIRFAGVVFLLIICHALLRNLAYFGLGVLALFAPVAFIIYTDRFRGAPQPEQFANFFAAVGVAGALLFLPAVTIVCAAALLGLGAAWLASRAAVTGVEYDRNFTVTRVFPHDETDLLIRIANRKLMPLAWFRISDCIHIRGGSRKHRLNQSLEISGRVELVEQHLSALVNQGGVGPFTELTRTVHVKALRRGVYALGPAHIETGDPFGLFTREVTLGRETELIVYPRRIPSDDVGPSFWASIGALTRRRTLFEDPTMLAGSRDYQPEDPLNRIHWKATARTGDLQVRVHDPTTTSEVMIVLNVHTHPHAWQGVDPERMEASIEVAASIASWMLGRKFAVGICSNGAVADAERTDRVGASASPHQEATVLEHLARLSYAAGYAAPDLLRREANTLGPHSSIVFVTPVITPEILVEIQSARLRNRVSVAYCGRVAAPVVPGIPIHLVAPARDHRRAAS
ncbi:MAG: DUF58 domain-containing protein [Chloroflexota bacterium]